MISLLDLIRRIRLFIFGPKLPCYYKRALLKQLHYLPLTRVTSNVRGHISCQQRGYVAITREEAPLLREQKCKKGVHFSKIDSSG